MTFYQDFCSNYPIQTITIQQKEFTYRHFENKDAKHTVVLLVGGLGLSDLFYEHFIKLSKNFSVVTFDYSYNFSNVESLIDAIYFLIKSLDKKCWFIGQSLGGFIAQLIAIKYPQITKGLVLSNTGSFYENLSETAYESLMAMIKKSHKSKQLLKLIPFSIFKKIISTKIMKTHANNFDEESKSKLKALCEIMEKTLTKKYELHMIDLLIDMQNHLGCNSHQFEYLNKNILLILSDDDQTFHPEVKEALSIVMPNASVVKNLDDGHLALIVNCDAYINLVTSFILDYEGAQNESK